MKCELCGDEIPGGHDGRELAKVMGLRQKGDFDPFPLCRACYNDIERAIASAWLSKIVDGEKDESDKNEICTDYMRVCEYCNRPAIATSQESLEQLTKDWDYYKDNDKYCCDKCKEKLGK